MFIGGLSWQTSPGKPARPLKDIHSLYSLAILNHLSAEDEIEDIMIRYGSLRNVTDCKLDGWGSMLVKGGYFTLRHHAQSGQPSTLSSGYCRLFSRA
jgi:hypothetical protein